MVCCFTRRSDENILSLRAIPYLRSSSMTIYSSSEYFTFIELRRSTHTSLCRDWLETQFLRSIESARLGIGDRCINRHGLNPAETACINGSGFQSNYSFADIDMVLRSFRREIHRPVTKGWFAWNTGQIYFFAKVDAIEEQWFSENVSDVFCLSIHLITKQSRLILIAKNVRNEIGLYKNAVLFAGNHRRREDNRFFE